jgi:hypothetical protein
MCKIFSRNDQQLGHGARKKENVRLVLNETGRKKDWLKGEEMEHRQEEQGVAV